MGRMKRAHDHLKGIQCRGNVTGVEGHGERRSAVGRRERQQRRVLRGRLPHIDGLWAPAMATTGRSSGASREATERGSVGSTAGAGTPTPGSSDVVELP